MDADKPFLLDLSTLSEETIKKHIFDPLYELDEGAIFARVDASEASHLSKHLWYVNRRRWSGMLVIHVPNSILTSDAVGTIRRPVMPLAWSARSQSLSAKDFVREPLLSAITLASIVADAKGTVAIILETDDASLFSEPEWPADIERAIFIVPSKFVSKDLFQTLRSESEFRFAGSHVSGILDCLAGVDEIKWPHAKRLQRMYMSWVQQELGSDAASEEFSRLYDGLFNGEIGEQTSTVLPSNVQDTLGILRVCRHISRWTLEGSPIECSFILVPQFGDKDTADYKAAYHLLEKRKLCFVALDHIRNLVEIAHVSGFFITVNLSSGIIEQLTDFNAGYMKHGRHELLPSLSMTQKPCALIHCTNGFVEVYSEGKLKLWHDGFKWWPTPFSTCEAIFEDFFRSDINYGPKLVAAIATILDRQESSVICLLNKQDMEGMDEYARKFFRTGVSPADWIRENFLCHSLDVIVSVLHLDGAHFISCDGQLCGWAREIESPGATDEQPGPGAGTRAAKKLSEQLKKSYVLKTSSSGFMKCFVGGRAIQRPQDIQF